MAQLGMESYFHKRFSAQPKVERIRDVILDLDGTFLRGTASIEALREILGKDDAATFLEKEQARMMADNTDLADIYRKAYMEVKGKPKANAQVWNIIAEKLWATHDTAIARAIRAAQLHRTGETIRLHIVSGAPKEFTAAIAGLLSQHYGIEVSTTIGSGLAYDSSGNMASPKYSVGGRSSRFPAMYKHTMIERFIAKRFVDFHWKTTMVIENEHPELLAKAAIGFLVPDEKNTLDMENGAQKNRWYDAIAHPNADMRERQLTALITHPMETLKRGKMFDGG